MTESPLAYALMRRGESEEAAAAAVAAEEAARAGEEALGAAPAKVMARAARLRNFRRYFEPRSLTFRLVAGAMLWSVVAFMGVGLILSQLFRDVVLRAFDARLMVVLETLVAGSEVRPDGELVMTPTLGDPRFEQALSGWYWQVEGPHGVGAPPGPDMRSRSLWNKMLLPPPREANHVASADMVGPVNQHLRVISRDIELPGSDVPFVFTVAGDRKELEAEIARFDRLLVWSLSGLGLGLIIGIVVLVQVGLKPLRSVSAALADIRSGRTNRLSGDFPAEIAPLAVELNALVAHNQSLLERARRHVGNLAHALKTPLTVLTNEAHRAEGPSGETLAKQLAIMRAQIDHYLSRARVAATSGLITSRTLVLPVLSDLQRTLARIYAERGLAIALEAGDWLAFRGEREDLEEMMGNLMDNACKWAKTNVRVSARAEPAYAAEAPSARQAGLVSNLVLAVEDDGPGLEPEAVAKVLTRGARLDETVPGSGLGLSIVRDLAELYGGKVAFDKSELGGLRVTLTLPAAQGAG